MLNLICILLSFQAVYSFSISLTEFELVRLSDGRDALRLAGVMGCKSAKLLIKYLGLLLGPNIKI